MTNKRSVLSALALLLTISLSQPMLGQKKSSGPSDSIKIPLQTVTAISNAITSLTVQGLPEDYYQTYAKNVSAVTNEDLLRVAKQYIDLNHLAIVIVGDRSQVEGPLKATNIAPITYVDIE